METKCEKQQKNNYTLVKGDKKFNPETVLLIGNGAIEKGNIPLEKFVCNSGRRSNCNQFSNAMYTQDPAIHYLARYAYFFRSQRDELLDIIAEHGLDKETLKNYEFLDIFVNYRKSLANEYKNATKEEEITLRNKEEILNNYYSVKTTGIITINWDEILWNNNKIGNIIQLHGRCSITDSLILPTELTLDENTFKLIKKYETIEKNNITEGIEPYFRRDGVRCSLKEVHVRASKWLRNAKKIIIWGVAFNVYDSELISLFRTSAFEKLTEITIINPNYTHRNIAAALIYRAIDTTLQFRIDINPETGKKIHIYNENLSPHYHLLNLGH